MEFVHRLLAHWWNASRMLGTLRFAALSWRNNTSAKDHLLICNITHIRRLIPWKRDYGSNYQHLSTFQVANGFHSWVQLSIKKFCTLTLPVRSGSNNARVAFLDAKALSKPQVTVVAFNDNVVFIETYVCNIMFQYPNVCHMHTHIHTYIHMCMCICIYNTMTISLLSTASRPQHRHPTTRFHLHRLSFRSASRPQWRCQVTSLAKPTDFIKRGYLENPL